MNRWVTRAVALLAATAVFLAAGCVGSTYDERVKYLDKMTEAGIVYRGDLQRQGTPVTTDACRTGYRLLSPRDIPDPPGQSSFETWRAQVEEAYVKGCMTGQPRPKPEPGGTEAVTPVPHNGGPTESPTSSPSS